MLPQSLTQKTRMAAVFLDVVLVTGLEVELVVDVFAPDHLHTQPQSPPYSRTHPFHPPLF